MTVEADVPGLVANGINADTCPFVFSAATHPVEGDALAALGRAIELTDAFLAVHAPDLDLGGEPPHVSPDGVAASVAGGPHVDGDDIARWFLTLAGTLSTQGWSGVLLPQRWGDRPDERTYADPWLAVTLALSGWAHREREVVVPPWHVDPDLAPRLVDAVLEWTRGIDGDLWFTRATPVRGEEPGVAQALLAQLSEPTSRGASIVHRQGATAERRARFSSYGHLTLEERSSAPLDHRLAVLRAAATDGGLRVDRSATTGDVGQGHPSWFVELARRDASLPKGYYPHGRHLDDRRVPDACAEQVLTRAHLDAAADLGDWQVEEVEEDRFLVAHPQPSRWFVPAPPGESGTRVDPQVLARARADFGPMVLSATDL